MQRRRILRPSPGRERSRTGAQDEAGRRAARASAREEVACRLRAKGEGRETSKPAASAKVVATWWPDYTPCPEIRERDGVCQGFAGCIHFAKAYAT